jgi:hypothetical protein
MKKKCAVLVVGLLVIASAVYGVSGYIQLVKVFEGGTSYGSVTRYYDQEADIYVYVSREGLQTEKGRSWN